MVIGPLPPDAAEPERRWTLTPGVCVVRRGADRLQVGLAAPHRVVLPRTAETVATLAALAVGAELPRTPGAAALLDRLAGHGWLSPASPPTTPLTCLLSPPDHESDALRGCLGDLVAAAGLPTTRAPRRADVVLVPSQGEPPRELLDPLVRDEVPHLLLRLLDGGAVLGPFVDPGRTACQRCLDAHLGDLDPEHAAVLARYVAASTLAHPSPPVTPTLLAAWAVREVLAWAAGHEPSTWSTTWSLDPDGSAPRPQRWRRHPRCGCAWPSLASRVHAVGEASPVAPSGTMEA